MVVSQITAKGARYAVEFERDGRPYRTLWTPYEGEAHAWALAVACYGWAVSGRPMPYEATA